MTTITLKKADGTTNVVFAMISHSFNECQFAAIETTGDPQSKWHRLTMRKVEPKNLTTSATSAGIDFSIPEFDLSGEIKATHRYSGGKVFIPVNGSAERNELLRAYIDSMNSDTVVKQFLSLGILP